MHHPAPGATVLLLLMAVLGSRSVHAQTGGPYDLSWSTIDAGGNSMTGGPYALDGTTGQPDAGELAGGTYRLGGGFWGGGQRFVVGVFDWPAADGIRVNGMEPARPNPFSVSSVLGFSVTKSQHVKIRVFDLRGRLVRTLLDEGMGAGRHFVTWDAKDNRGHRVPNGVYLARLSTVDMEASTKLVFLGDR